MKARFPNGLLGLLRKVVVASALGVGILASMASLGIIFDPIIGPGVGGGDNSCEWANDGECDEWGLCGPGTDCSDCGGCGDGDDNSNALFFSCTDSANNLCGNYYPANSERYNTLIAGCGNSSSSPCSIGGSVCTMRSSEGDCQETYQNPPASNFDAACTSNGGSLGANCP